MSSFDASEESISRTSSDTFTFTFDPIPSTLEDTEEDSLNNEFKLTRIMNWFNENNIEEGDPRVIQQNCLKEGRGRVIDMLS